MLSVYVLYIVLTRFSLLVSTFFFFQEPSSLLQVLQIISQPWRRRAGIHSCVSACVLSGRMFIFKMYRTAMDKNGLVQTSYLSTYFVSCVNPTESGWFKEYLYF